MAQTPALRVARGFYVDYTPTSAVTAGDVVLIGTIPMIADVDIAANKAGALACEGVFDIPKNADVFAVGDAVYWNASDTDLGSNTGAADNAVGNIAGVCVMNANAAATRARTKLTAAKRTATLAGAVTADSVTGNSSSLGVTGLAGAASAGGGVAIAGGAAAAGAYNGGPITIAGGAGPTAGNVGGAVTILSGAGDGTNGTAGAVILDSSGTGSVKGTVTIGTNAASVTIGKEPRCPVAIVAANGGNIATAGILVAGTTVVTGSNNAKGVVLPAMVNSAKCVIVNQITDKTLKIYPPLGGQINNLGANNAITLVANGTAVCVCEGTNTYYAWLGAGIMA